MNQDNTVYQKTETNKTPNIVLFEETETNRLYLALKSVYNKYQKNPRLYSLLTLISSTSNQFSSMLLGDKTAFEQKEYPPKQLEEARRLLGINNLGKEKFMIMNSAGDIGIFCGQIPNLSLSRSYYNLFHRDISDIGVIVLPNCRIGEQFMRKIQELLIPLEDIVSF